MTVYAILSKVEEPVPSGKIDFVASNDGKTGTAFTVPSGITKVRVTMLYFDKMYNETTQRIYVYSVTAGETLHANNPPYFVGYPGATPIAVRSQTLEYGPEINELKEGLQ